MAGTEEKPSTTAWINLGGALARVQAHIPLWSLSRLLIKSAVEAGGVKIRAWHYVGRVAGDPPIEDPAFWHAPPGQCRIRRARFLWERSCVYRPWGGHWGGLKDKGYTAHQVEVFSEDIDALIAAWAPVAAAEPLPLHGNKLWVFNELKRNPPRPGDRFYNRRLWKRSPDKSVTLKTIHNLVSECR